jgi:tetratricopeptide (TPR) repeat protein
VHELTPAQLKQKKEIDQKALEFIDKGIDFFASGNFKDAIDQFETALKLNPDIPEAYQNLASAYFRAGFYQKAIEAAQKALDLNPNSVQMVKLLSVAYSSLGNEDKALEYHEKLKAFPDTEFSAEELYNMGVIEANRRNDGAAAEYFEKAARAKPDFALVHYQLGLCYFRLSNWEGAKKELGEYLALDPQGDNGETAKALLANIK